jgi:hypothetical protein
VKTPRSPRPVCEVDPLLAVTLRELAAKYGREAVLAAAQAVGKREFNPDATRADKAQLAEIIDRLAGVWDKREVFSFLTRQRAANVPMATSIEILQRIVATKAVNCWAMVNHIMRNDYPNYKWGRS